HATQGHRVPGGILVGDAVVYDALSRLLLGSLVQRIAADVAAGAPAGAPRPPVDPAGPPAPVRGDRSRPGSGHDGSRPSQRHGRPGRDRARPAPWCPGAYLGLPVRRPATSVRTTPCAHARSG